MFKISRPLRILAALSVSGFLLAGTSACAAALPGGTGSCELTVDNAHASARKPGFIDGKGKVKCVFTKGSATDLKIETRLEKKNSSGNWVVVPNSSATTTKATVKTGVTYTGVSGFVPCAKGTFRASSRAGGYLDGKYSGLSNWEPSAQETVNPCG